MVFGHVVKLLLFSIGQEQGNVEENGISKGLDKQVGIATMHFICFGDSVEGDGERLFVDRIRVFEKSHDTTRSFSYKDSGYWKMSPLTHCLPYRRTHAPPDRVYLLLIPILR